MKRVYFIPMSANEKDTENKINEAIEMIETKDNIEWITELCKATDESKYMLVGEQSEIASTGEPVPVSRSIGVKVVQGSQDKTKTEKLINDTLLEMELDGDKTFLSICHPAEFMYIILYECKSGKFPRIKIITNPADPYIGSRSVSSFLQVLDEDLNWDLQPYDSFMLDKNNIIILFS